MEECKVDLGQQSKQAASPETVAFVESSSEVQQEDSRFNLTQVPSEKTFLLAQPPSPKSKKSLSSSVEPPSPKSKKSLSSSAEPSTPKPRVSISSPTETSSPKQKEKRSDRKSSKGKKRDGSQKRKQARERKRGLSTSSSDDPKSSRSRTGSETVDGSESGLQLSSEWSTAQIQESSGSQQLLITEADTLRENNSDISKVFADIHHHASPVDTSSPIVKDSRKKKKRRKDGEGSERRRHSSGKKKRGLSTSSSDDPKGSCSQTELLSSEALVSSTGFQVPAVECHVAEEQDCSQANHQQHNSKVESKMLLTGTGVTGLTMPVKCSICISDYDATVDISEC